MAATNHSKFEWGRTGGAKQSGTPWSLLDRFGHVIPGVSGYLRLSAIHEEKRHAFDLLARLVELIVTVRRLAKYSNCAQRSSIDGMRAPLERFESQVTVGNLNSVTVAYCLL